MTFLLRRCLIIFLVLEIIIFFLIYSLGPKSLKSLHEMYGLKNQTMRDITNLQAEIVMLKQEVEQARTDFAKEKIARERLLMKKDDELVYVKNDSFSCQPRLDLGSILKEKNYV
jgi:cell division protein FtsB